MFKTTVCLFDFLHGIVTIMFLITCYACKQDLKGQLLQRHSIHTQDPKYSYYTPSRYAPEGGESINRNIPTRGVIISL